MTHYLQVAALPAPVYYGSTAPQAPVGSLASTVPSMAPQAPQDPQDPQDPQALSGSTVVPGSKAASK